MGFVVPRILLVADMVELNALDAFAGNQRAGEETGPFSQSAWMVARNTAS